MTNAADRAYEKIRANILSGVYAPEALLKEIELVDSCGVSRTPIREALRRLAAEDFVVIRQNQSAQVKSWSEDDLDDLFSLRSLLEGYAAARAAHRISEQSLQTIEAAIREMDQILVADAPAKRKIDEFLRHNWTVHECVWRAAGSDRLVSMLRRIVQQALMAHTAQRFSVARIAQSHHHHEELLQALRAGDGAWAKSIMKCHIRAARHSLGEPAEPHKTRKLATADDL